MTLFKRDHLVILRNIVKRKTSSAVMIGSISVGLCIATILFGFIERENNTDSFHRDKDLIYRLLSNDPFEDNGTLAYIVKDGSEYLYNFPEVDKTCRAAELSGKGLTLQHEAGLMDESMVVAVDSNFFQLFDFSFFQGNKNDALRSYGIVVTKNLAIKIFGEANVLGKAIVVHYDTLKIPFSISGVLEETEENTHFRFDALVPFSNFDSYLNGSVTYLSLNPNSEVKALENKISNDTQMPSLIGPGKSQYYLQSLTDIYFDDENVRRFTTARNPDFILISWIIIFLILFIAIFNFINLFALSLVERRREFGVKKVIGASVSNIVSGLTLEVAIYLAISLAISLLATFSVIPIFNGIFESNLGAAYFLNVDILMTLGFLFISLMIIISGFLSPYLNKIRPVSLMGDRNRLRFKTNKLFFVLQFVISMTLILCALVVIKQTQYIKNKPLGFDRNILELRTPKGQESSNLKILKHKLSGLSIFDRSKISIASGNPISGNQMIRYDLNDEQFYAPYFIEGDEDLITTLGLNLKEGTSLRPSASTDKIVNEKFVQYFNIEDPIGTRIPGSPEDKIVGVVSDFNVSSLKQEIPLYIIGYKEEAPRILINYSGLEFEEVKSRVEKSWNQVFPDNPFTFTLLGDELLIKHKEDYFLAKIIITFACLSIIISCFGLFSLAQSNCQKKGKEIAIRKTMGATIASIVSLLLFDFGKWILLSFFIASAIGYFTIQNWLETFTYHTDIGWLVFFGTAIVTGIVSFLAMGIQTVQAALANPVNRLRYE